MTLQERFEQWARTYITRDGIEGLLQVLAKSDFYTAPASTRHHNSFDGGLAEHSISVCRILMQDVGKDFNLESLAIVSLFHDICKIGYYKVDYRNNKNEKGQWEKVPYYTVDDIFPYGHGEKSVLLVQEHMKLTDEELMAIRWHMGAYEGQQAWNTVSTAFEKFPLALHLHIADMKSTYLMEKRGVK